MSLTFNPIASDTLDTHINIIRENAAVEYVNIQSKKTYDDESIGMNNDAISMFVSAIMFV